MKINLFVFLISFAFPSASYSRQPLTKKTKAKKVVKILKTEPEFGTFKFVSPFLVKKSIFIG